MLYGYAEQLAYPFSYPDPTSEFYGYEKYGIYTANGVKPGTRTLLNWALLAATTLVIMQTGQRVHAKGHAVTQYQQLIGDEWATFLTELYRKGKLEWGYDVPKTAVSRQ